MVIREIEIEKIKPYENNPKKHPQKQIDRIIESIKEFGFVMPILVDDDFNIISGHGRYEAVKQMGMEKISCIINSSLTEGQKRAYRIADNKLAESEYDYEKMRQEFMLLKEADFKLDVTGFSVDEINMIIENMDIDKFFENGEGKFFEDEEIEETPKQKIITCPNCGKEIDISEYI